MIILPFLVLFCNLFAYDKDRTIIIGTVENLPPFSFYENNILKGIDVEIINEISKRLNLNIVIETLPWARVISELKNGDLDAAFSLYYVEDRKEFLFYLAIMHYDNLGIMARKDNIFIYKSTEDLFSKKIGKGAGVFVSDEFQKAKEDGKITVEEINDTEMGNIKKLIAKRLDAVIGVAETMKYYAKNLKPDNELVIVTNFIESNRPGYLVFSKRSVFSNDDRLLGNISKEITEIMTDGTYLKIRDNYDRFY